MKKELIRTFLRVFTGDGEFDAAQVTGVIDIALKNTGTDPVRVSFSAGSMTTILEADAMLSLGGYHDKIRTDELQIKFEDTTSNKRLEVFGNRIVKEC